MLNQEIKEKIMHDLNITERRARIYAKLFADKYGGNVRAITHVSATYTDNGNLRISYIINDRKYHIGIDVKNPYADEVKKRPNINTDGKQVVQLLNMLYPDITAKEWEDDWVNTFTFEERGRVLRIKVCELPALDKTVNALKSCCINLSEVGVETRCGHLTLVITNFNIETKKDIQFTNE